MASNSTITSDVTSSETSTYTSPSTDLTPTTLTSSVPVIVTSDSSTVVLQSPTTTTVISVSQSPTATVIVTPSISSTPVAIVSSTVLIDPATTGGTSAPFVVTITSTQNPVTVTPTNTQVVSSSTTSSSSPSILGASGSHGSSGGLSSSGKIAIAVIIPIVVIALLFFLGIFLWRKRKARKSAEEQRKNEMAEYGFNPNNDPDLVPVGAAYTDGGSEADDGYRGWGTTSSNPRKPSTTLGSNGKPQNGMAHSDTTSQPGNYNYQSSPNGHASEHWSGDPLVPGHPERFDGVGALGGAAAAGGLAGTMASRNNRMSQGIQRGPSNASSTYSHNPPQSETSSETPVGNYYQEEVPYNIYNDVAPSHGPYGDGTYATGGVEQPVIRDVQARRNTRIERVPTFPQTQGGISQNF